MKERKGDEFLKFESSLNESSFPLDFSFPLVCISHSQSYRILLSVCVDRFRRIQLSTLLVFPLFQKLVRSLSSLVRSKFASILRFVNHHPLMPYSRHHPLQFRWLKPSPISLVRLNKSRCKKKPKHAIP